MAVNLSIKNVPDDIARGLRERAARNHRSLQNELLTIVETATLGEESVTVDTLLAHARASGLTPCDEAVAILRTSRNRRSVNG
jgi:plasmid stability protein